ncbi:MAG: AmmeMemoRadiSam system radical SAM enzyme [Candidatus Marinimicrobia bacterium]|nr:AmmeMemoRadiSam system radical SAM enzyme [Candidatus Neomarinimicrobiota bacterium]
MTARAEAAPASPLQRTLDGYARPRGELVLAEKDGALRCLACAHRCLIKSGRRGICRVRLNRDGELLVPYGYVAGLQNDPIEKKPFYHFLPGATALTFGMLGCSLHCSYCQNWLTSQALRDQAAGTLPEEVTPAQVAQLALDSHARVVVSSYNEPLISAEWASAVFKAAREVGLKTALVSNGYATAEVLEYLRPVTDAIKVDLKSMADRTYRALGGVLQPVLDSIRLVRQLGYWLEIVTLVVPGLNDSDDELRELATFIADVSPDIPWHVNAFHPDYRMTDRSATPARTVLKARKIGLMAGLKFIYAGNLPDLAPEMENTHCPACNVPLIRRAGYYILDDRLAGGGACPRCETLIPGVWA